MENDSENGLRKSHDPVAGDALGSLIQSVGGSHVESTEKQKQDMVGELTSAERESVLSEVDRQMTFSESNPDKCNYATTVSSVKKARDLGIDVTAYEEKLIELEKVSVSADIASRLNHAE